jgi:hypothetical protein
MGATASAIIDFGAAFTDLATVVITGQTNILSSSKVEAYLDPTQPDTPDHSSDEHVYAEIDVRCSAIVAGTGFTINARARGPYMMYGKWNVTFVWV